MNNDTLPAARAVGLAALLVGLGADAGCGNNTLEQQNQEAGLALGAASVVALGSYNADIHQTSVSGSHPGATWRCSSMSPSPAS